MVVGRRVSQAWRVRYTGWGALLQVMPIFLLKELVDYADTAHS
jgi:hypothetical protein